MKTIYLVHGWGGNPQEHWFPWLKSELLKKGHRVFVFDMPETNNPKIETWVKFLEENVKILDKDTFFVGHSIGCQTILRFLEKLPKQQNIGGCVFVAGWFNLINLEPEEMEIAHPWINSKMDFSRILRHTSNFLAIFSDNDPWVHKEESKIFKENLGAKIILKKNQEHFDSVEKIPEILGWIK